jgi:hypothetical protein
LIEWRPDEDAAFAAQLLRSLKAWIAADPEAGAWQFVGLGATAAEIPLASGVVFRIRVPPEGVARAALFDRARVGIGPARRGGPTRLLHEMRAFGIATLASDDGRIAPAALRDAIRGRPESASPPRRGATWPPPPFVSLRGFDAIAAALVHRALAFGAAAQATERTLAAAGEARAR